MSNALQANREEFLSKCSDQERKALAYFEERTRKITVPFRGATTSMADVLHVSSEGSHEPLHCSVHEEWPWHAIGRLQLEHRIEAIAAEERDDVSPELMRDILDLWRDTFHDKLLLTLSEHPDVIRIKHPEPDGRTDEPDDIVSCEGVGYLDEKMFARFAEKSGGIPPSRPVEIHGATYACCPTQFGLQLGTARNLGIFLPARPHDDDRKDAMHLETVRNTLYKYGTQLCSDISFGVLMDCIGLINKPGRTHEDNMMRKHTHRMMSADTLILPDQHPMFHHTSGLIC